jgi:D-3-phosphoglycerate dehydrogenase
MSIIVIPDDYPVVMGSSPSFFKLREGTPCASFDTLPGTEESLVSRIHGAAAVINIRASTKFPASVFAACPDLKLLSIWGTGTDHVDLTAARRYGVVVTNTPGVSASSIAEHSLMLALAVARRVVEIHQGVVAGGWPRGRSVQLQGKTLGVIGLGAVGRRLARLGQGIGMRVIAWTMHPDPALGFELVELDDLLRTSDVVSLHLRLSPQTMGFLGRDRLALMKPGAILINTARGPIVDEAALVDVLRERRIAGAGLDVFDTEPLPAGHPLTRLDNVTLTSHCAGVTAEALEDGLAMAIENVLNYLNGNPTHVVSVS